MADDDFRFLVSTDVCDILNGTEEGLYVEFKNHKFKMPYRTTNDLLSICNQFDVAYSQGDSRCKLTMDILRSAVKQNKCDDVLNYFFDLIHFTDLKVGKYEDIYGDPIISSLDEADKVHDQIVNLAIECINRDIILSHHELKRVGGHFYMIKIDKAVNIETDHLDKFSVDYVVGLKDRCKEDLNNGNYDSVITKSRTLLEEMLIHILEEAKKRGLTTEEPTESGNLTKLYNQVKKLKGMKQLETNDKRINELLSGLDKIVQSIAEMRNLDSDAHGRGEKRIGINAKEARLVMNASMMICEYLVSEKTDK